MVEEANAITSTKRLTQSYTIRLGVTETSVSTRGVAANNKKQPQDVERFRLIHGDS